MELTKLIQKGGGTKRLIKNRGLLYLIDSGLQFFYFKLVSRFYKFKKCSYGVSEAICYPKAIDRWWRYSDTVCEILKFLNRNLSTSILEVGSGGSGISNFLNLEKSRILLMDIDKKSFIGTKNIDRIIADGCSLPFKNTVFDFVISVATIEHIPKERRNELFAELKRVFNKKIILHFPLESGDKVFRGREYDITFQKAHKRLLGFEDPNAAEHISSGYTTVKEIEKEFPNSRRVGRKNCSVWLNYMISSRVPIFGFLTGLIYLVRWKKKDNLPPYYECMLVYPE
jgi:ubiquinone/menaquinone biosynthesis C-methylase UbiE